MPLPKRLIEPVFVARSVYQQDELQIVELETVTNTTLTNIIRQLSSLSKHAEDVFGELARDVGNIGDRANSLQARIDRLSIKVTQLDSNVEEVPLTDITRKKAFKSAKIFDQQIFSRATMPAPMLETYSQCDKPPPLEKLNIYRDDGKDGLKFYTDPNYFFELWRQEMLKDTERVMHDKGKKMNRPREGNNNNGGTGRGHKKRVRAPHNTREKQRQIAIGLGETLMPNNIIYRTPNSTINEQQQHGYNGIYETRPARPNSIEIHRRDAQQTEQIDGTGYGVGTPNLSEDLLPNNSSSHYSAAYVNNGNGVQKIMHNSAALHQQQQQHLLQQQQQQHQQHYDESLYSQSQLYMQQQQQVGTPETIYGPGGQSRTKLRPSQPPPAPPSNSSGGGTPNESNANTPTRGRSLSTSRDALPPPPPIPDNMVNTTSPSQMLAAMNGGVGGNAIAAKLLGRTNSITRAGSPQLPSATSNTLHDANALVMAQLNNTINSFNHMNMNGMTQQMMNNNDLPPPPPLLDQNSPTMSPPNAAPPPPPPPPPLGDGGNTESKQQQQIQVLSKTLANGNITANGVIISAENPHIVGQRKLLPPYHDTRNDLMKAIRDGITLRKVEKSEQKEIERNTALHDVASILARRVAIELSESSDSDSEDDSEGWVEHNETSA